jgi:hypothetical protein
MPSVRMGRPFPSGTRTVVGGAWPKRMAEARNKAAKICAVRDAFERIIGTSLRNGRETGISIL